MKIGIVTTWYASGAGMVSRAYAEALSKDNEVFIFARGCKRQKGNIWDTNNVTWAKKHPSITGVYVNEFKKWVKKNKINLVLFNEQRRWDIILEAKKMNIIIGAYVDYYTADTVQFFDLYDFLICNTKRHYSVFNSHKNVLFCQWGTNNELFIPKKTRENRPITFLVSSGNNGKNAKVASWADRTGAGFVLENFSKIKGNCRLVFLSQVKLSECPTRWKQIIDSDSRINFIDEKFEFTPYHLGDIYLYPSRLDGIGLTLPEAISCGLPAIVTNSEPMSDFVIDNFNGFLIDVKQYLGRPDGYFWAETICDGESLVRKMECYISNPGLLEEHSINSRELAIEKFNWSKNSKNLSHWMSGIKKVNEVNREFINGVSIENVKRYDRLNNPTPLERVLLGIKRFIK